MHAQTRHGVSITALSLAALLTITACSADTSTPDGLGEAIADAATDHDNETIAELACKKKRKELLNGLDTEQLRKNLKAPELTINVEFVKSEANGDKAKITLKTTFEDLPPHLTTMGMPTTRTHKLNAVRTGESWTICD